MNTFRRGIALAMSVLMIGVLAACQPPATNPSQVATCSPATTPTGTILA